MSKRLSIAALVLVACQSGGPPAVKRPGGIASPAASAKRPAAAEPSSVAPPAAPTPSAPGGATATPAVDAVTSPTAAPPTPALAMPDVLRRPADDVKVLSGIVRVDAAYVVANNGGTLANGKLLAAAGLASVGNVLANNGASLAAAADVLSNNGGGLVSTNGGAVISNNGGGYHLADVPASPTADAAAPGHLVPVAGIALGVYSLSTHEPVAVGVDRAGKPVYTVNTDLDGHYELYLPKDFPDANVLLIADLDPRSADPRYHYGLATPVKTGVTLDEDTAVTTRFLRKCFQARISPMLTSTDASATVTAMGIDYYKFMVAPITQMVTDLNDRAKRSGLAVAPAADVDAAAGRIADSVLAAIDLGTDPGDADAIYIEPGVAGWQGTRELLLPAYADIFQLGRIKAAQVLASDPTYFEKQGYFISTNILRANAGLPALHILRPTDLHVFLADEVFGDPLQASLRAKQACYGGGGGYVYPFLNTILEGLGANKIARLGTVANPLPAPASGTQADRFFVGFQQVLLRLVTSLAPGTSGRAQVDALIDAYKPGAAGGTPVPRVTPAVPQVDPCSARRGP